SIGTAAHLHRGPGPNLSASPQSSGGLPEESPKEELNLKALLSADRPGRRDHRRSSLPMPGHPGFSGFMWHASPFGISRTPNIHTPVSHYSPSRSPVSFSGYCSPNTGLPSGVASPNRRGSQSGYSSPSTMGNAFLAMANERGLMRRLMSLREARGEDEEREDDSEWSSGDDTQSEDGGAPDLLECLLQHAERVPPSRNLRDPPSLCLDL
ncbi:unnamed protein product, partial [Polarella glacialis]